jgi:hypothetical protein
MVPCFNPENALEQIENNSWYRPVSDKEKPRLRGLMQIDVVFKIMMYIRTVFGMSHFKDDRGNDLYLNELDIDSNNVYQILFSSFLFRSSSIYPCDPDKSLKASIIQ